MVRAKVIHSYQQSVVERISENRQNLNRRMIDNNSDKSE